MMKKTQTAKTKDKRKDDEVPYVPNYTFEQANELLKRMVPKDFTVSDTVLLLLYAFPEKPVYGRVLFVKEMFLLNKEILNKEKFNVQDAQFVPYRYGPYSFVLGNELTNLEYFGYISRTGPKNAKGEKFTLTEKGKLAAKAVWEKLSAEIKKEIQDGRIGWDELGRNGILKYVYLKYPEFTKKSYIKGRYKSVSWGKDWIIDVKKGECSNADD